MIAPTSLSEYQMLLRVMPKLVDRVTCLSCGYLLMEQQDFIAHYHVQSCMLDEN